jgi:hypothetical protein
VSRRGIGRPRRWILLACLLCGAPSAADAQVFLASRPDPAFTIGPLVLRAGLGSKLGPVTVEILWSLVLPPARGTAVVPQDLYLLWPTAVSVDATVGRPDPELARYVEARGFAVTEEGRVPLFAQSLQQMGGDLPLEPVPGGAPFATFVGQGGPLGLTAPATYIRIPWSPKLADRRWMLDLRLTIPDLIRPRKATWFERAFSGPRYEIALSFNDVRSRALFPMYFEHRDRVIRLAEEPSQILINFAEANRLKIDEVSPPSSHRRVSETLENTEVVSSFIDPSEGLAPQVLTVQFGYFSGVQAWAPVLIPTVFFLLGNLAAVLVRTVGARVGKRLARRVRFGRPGPQGGSRQTGVILSRETLARLVPGATTYDEVLRICGPEVEQLEQLSAPDRRSLVYRGRRVVPQRRRTFGWLATVGVWIVEQHEVEIELERNVVIDVRARVRRSRLDHPESA